jgi:hypothetical protein
MEDLLLDHILNTTAYTPGAVTVHLTTTLSTDAAHGTEVTGGSYAAKTITFQAASGGAALNNAVSWTGMPACTVVGWYLTDSHGNDTLWGSLDTPQTMSAGATFTLAANQVTVTAD